MSVAGGTGRASRGGGAMVVAAVCLLSGLALSAAHPLGHGLMPVAFAVVVAGLWWKPHRWPLVVLGGLPLAGLAPWSGWLLLDEVDLLVLACAAAGYARLHALTSRSGMPDAAEPSARFSGFRRPEPTMSPAHDPLATLFLMAVTMWLVVMIIGWLRVPGAVELLLREGLPISGSYHQPLMGARLLKPLLAVLLLWPLWRLTDATQVRLGLLAGLLGCGLWVVWERVTYAALLDFSSRYRVTGPFWETHVGGASLDAFLAAGWPVALAQLAHALRRHAPVHRVVAAALALVLTFYAMAVTYSRITYGVMLVGALLWWGLDRWMHAHRHEATASGARSPKRMRWVAAVAAVAVLALGQAVMHSGSVIASRFETLEQDWIVRQGHWNASLNLPQGKVETWIGIGPGQFARRWRDAHAGPASGPASSPPPDLGAPQPYDLLPGRHSVVDLEGRQALKIEAASGARYWGQQHRVFQRLDFPGAATEVVQFRARVASPHGPTTLVVELCEKQLLYARRCAPRYVPVLRTEPGVWLEIRLPLQVRPRNLADGQPHPMEMRPLSLSLLSRDSRHPLYITDVSLRSPIGPELVDNGAFKRGLERWFFSSDMGHLPWSAHNAWVHVAVEQGRMGLVCLGLMAVVAVWGARKSVHVSWPLAPVLLAALFGFGVVGLVDSLLNQVRPAFLALLLMSACVARLGVGATAAEPAGTGPRAGA